MKTLKIAFLTLFFVGIVCFSAHAIVLFSEDFEGGDLSQWWDNKSGAITADPINTTNSVLYFTSTARGGDLFTERIYTSNSGHFTLSFDYLGFSRPDGYSGGFIAYENGQEKWLYGATPSYPGALSLLPDTGDWRNYQTTFSSEDPILLKLEDWGGQNGVPMDAFFDNIVLTDGTAPVPEPGTMALLATGLIGMVLYGRKKKMLN